MQKSSVIPAILLASLNCLTGRRIPIQWSQHYVTLTLSVQVNNTLDQQRPTKSFLGKICFTPSSCTSLNTRLIVILSTKTYHSSLRLLINRIWNVHGKCKFCQKSGTVPFFNFIVMEYQSGPEIYAVGGIFDQLKSCCIFVANLVSLTSLFLLKFSCSLDPLLGILGIYYSCLQDHLLTIVEKQCMYMRVGVSDTDHG